MPHIRVAAFVAFLPLLAACNGSGVRVTHGPMLGRPDSREMAVWARTSVPAVFRVRYGTDPTRLDLTSDEAKTIYGSDCTGSVMLKGLSPDTVYHYQVVPEGGAPGPAGSFRTLPDSAELVDPKLNPKGLFNFRFEFACGNDQREGRGAGPEMPALRTLLNKHAGKIHFAILNGDWLYEDGRETTITQWRRQTGANDEDTPRDLRLAPTLAGVWENYKIFLDRSPTLSQWHRQVPSLFTFDDHEILNDIYGTGTPGLRDRRAAFRDIGVRAWYDYLGWANPIAFTQGIHFGTANLKAGSDELVDELSDFTKLDLSQAGTLTVHWGTPTAGVDDNKLDGVGGDPNAGVYEVVKVLDKGRLRISPPARVDGSQTYSIGRQSYFRKRVANCEFHFLDTRSRRDMHDTKQPDKPGISMIGARQRQWLVDGMKASDADFHFVVSSVNFMVPHVGGGMVRETGNKDEAWTVFLREREELIEFWDGLGKPVFVLTGDLHNSFAIKITDRVWEFASGPHNSQNHKASDEGGRPGSGPFRYGPRACDIRWSTFYADDIARDQLRHPVYCIVQVNNVFNNPLKTDGTRWAAFPRPQVVFQYYDGRTGDLLYAEAVSATK